MWRDELGKMLEERVADAMQDYRRATGSNIDDAKLLKAQRGIEGVPNSGHAHNKITREIERLPIPGNREPE